MTEANNATLERAAEAFENIKKILVELWRKVKKIIIKFSSAFVDGLLRSANEYPKWWHLYKYSKKRRVRKKYRDKLMRQLLCKMRALNETREAIA